VDYFRKKQASPALHVYFLNCGNESVVNVPLEWSAFNKAIQVPVSFNTNTLCEGATLAFDLYVKTENCAGTWCAMHRASGNVFLSKALASNERCANVPLGNRWTGETIGTVGVCFNDVFKGIGFEPEESVDVKSEAFQTRMNALIDKEMGLFEGFWAVRSKNGFIKRVHAPVFNGRVASMPGFAYLMNAESFRGDEMWYLHWYTNACRRLEMKDDEVVRIVASQFASKGEDVATEFHKVTLLLATMVASCVTCYPYETDFYMDHGAQKPYESFDNVFVRKAGDCEDFGRGMHFVFSTFSSMKVSHARTGLRALQRVCRLFLSGVVLGSVAQNSHGASVFKTRQAHMYVKLFPVAYFTKSLRAVAHHGMSKARFPVLEEVMPAFEPWMLRLRTYTVEGTAPVQPFTSLRSMQSERDEDRAVFERRSTSLKMPKGMVREYRPIWGVFEDPFYKTDCHVYTNYYLRRGYLMGSFAFFDTKANVYGVPMQRVLDQEHVAIVPHQVVTEADLAAIRKALRYEHPMPKMTMTYRSGKEWVHDNPKVQKNVETFVNTLQSEARKTKATGKLYNDFFVQSPAQLTEQQLNGIVEFVRKHAESVQVSVEGLEPDEMVVRVRAYGLKERK
tara:strand:+ start:2427 stop:4286 length:1860 start_codon:yes stop_codon:yes gene_type:complete